MKNKPQIGDYVRSFDSFGQERAPVKITRIGEDGIYILGFGDQAIENPYPYKFDARVRRWIWTGGQNGWIDYPDPSESSDALSGSAEG